MTMTEIYAAITGLIGVGGFVTRVNYKTDRNERDIREVKDKNDDYHRKVYTALNDINVTLGRMDERIKHLQNRE